SSTYDRGTVNLWDVNSTIPLRTVSIDDQAVQGAAVSYDGTKIALVTASLVPEGVDRARRFVSGNVVMDPVNGVFVTNWTQSYDPFIRLFVYDVTQSVQEIHSIPLPTDENLSKIFPYKTKGFSHWNKYLGSVCFDRQGERVLVTSYDYNEKAANLGYPDNKELIESADNACFSLKDGRFLQSWGLDGHFQDQDTVYWKTVDFRPRMTSDGNRIFCGTEHGLTMIPREMGQPIHNTAFLNQMQGFDNSQVGSHAFYMRAMEDPQHPEIYVADEMDIAIASGEGGFAHLVGLGGWPHPDWKTRGDYNKLSVSPNGAFGAAGDFLFSMQTGALYSNFATANIEYRSGFNQSGEFWGFVMESPGSAIRTMRTTDTLATLYNIVHTTDVPANPFKMLYHRDGRTVAAVFETMGVKFYDMPTHTPGVFCAFNGKINDAALSEDGSFLLIAGGNTVRLYDTRTGAILRSFYPQHANVRDAQALSVQFAKHDNELMIGWNYNYIEIFQRVQPQSLEMTPVERSLMPGQSQAYRFKMTLEDATVLDVTPQAGTESTTFSVQVIPADKATIHDNIVTVAEGATGDFTILAVYRETGLWLQAQAHVTIAESQIQQLNVNPEVYRMSAGAFRPFFYTALYSDGYQEDVTDQVTLSTSSPQYLTIVDNQVKVNSGTPSGEYPVVGTYSNGQTTLTATGTVNVVVQGTAWDRFAVTGGGDGLSGGYSPDSTRLALGFGSGGVSLYSVGATPGDYALQQTFIAHTGAVRCAVFGSDTQLLTASEDGTIKVWDLADLTTPSLTCHHQAPVTCAAFVTGYLAFGDVLGNVGVYDLNARKVLWSKSVSSSPLRSIAVDSTSVVCGGENGDIYFLARRDGVQDAVLNQELNKNAAHKATVVAVGLGNLLDASSNSYQAIYTVSQDKTVKILKRADGSLVQTYPLPEIPTAAMLVGQSLYVATKNSPVIWVYDTKAGALAKMLEIGPENGEIAKLLIDPTAKYFLAGRRSSLGQNSLNYGLTTSHLSLYNDPYTPSSSFQFWEVSRGQYRDSAAHTYPLVSARMVGNDQLFTQCEKRAFKWNFDLAHQVTGNQRILETAYFSEPVYSGLDSTDDGQMLALRLTDRIYLYDLLQNQMVDALSVPSEAGPFAISPQKHYLATGDAHTQLWDLDTLSLIREDERPSKGLDFLTSQTLAGVVMLQKKLCLWNKEGQVIAESDTAHFPLKVLSNVNGSSCLVLSYDVENLSVVDRYTYYVEVFDTSSRTLNDPAKQRPMPIGTPVALFTTPWGFEDEYLIEDWAFAVSNDDTAVLVGPAGEKTVRLPAGLRSIRLYEKGSFKMQREFYPAYGPNQLITGAAGAAFSKDNSIIAVAWRDGYSELYRRQPPSALEVGLRPHESGGTEVYGADLDVFSGSAYDLRARLRYTNLEKVDVSGDTTYSITPAEKGTIADGVLTVSEDCKLGDTIVLKGEFLDSTRTITTSATLHVNVPTGTLAVTLLPSNAVTAGAQWRLTTDTSGTWRNSGVPLTLQTGVYTLEFKPLEGWTRPASQEVTILRDRVSAVSPLYIEYGHYALSVLTAGTGRGTVSVTPFELNYADGSQVMLVASASTSSTFTGWSGDVPEDQVHSKVLT
ncbi:MAG TPA: WD40 repeat domain-containing protein, partial [Candidatus Sumerlaeota bacterium]|nr:WD40 repeat domain-containing protein [Candidatus Sumerlaeota bacterium]